jgi:hypothetical protein
MLCHEFCNAANAPLGISAYQHTIRTTTLQNNDVDKDMRDPLTCCEVFFPESSFANWKREQTEARR